ncbi:MAG: hypothetical protein BGO77_03135 [Caedibacter sp. 37-49]|nr:MAG: hypothetical protein BGO77_03135 [Caedibacter sp. 37-49]
MALERPLENFESYRAAQTMARLSTICAVVLGLTVIALICVMIVLLPLKEVRPMLVTLKDKGEQVVHIEPFERNEKATTLLMETLSRQYVTLRETIDLQTEEVRWKHLSLMTGSQLNEEFMSLMKPDNQDSPFKKRLDEQVTREIQILSSTSLAPSAPNIFQVEWISRDRHKGQIIGQGHWVSTLTVFLEPHEVSLEDQYINLLLALPLLITHLLRKEARMLNNKSKYIMGLSMSSFLILSSVGNTNPQTLPQPPVMAPIPPSQDLMSQSMTSSLTEHPDVESQVKGQYPDLERKESLPLGAIQHAWDHAKIGAGVYNVTYTGAEIIKLRCREMMTTCIILPSWERVEKFNLGDPSSFKIENPKSNIITIQPQEFTGLDSNLIVIGASGKVYSFYLRSEGYNTNHVPDLAVYIRVAKPANLSSSISNTKSIDYKQKDDYLEEVPFDPSNLNFNFTMAGDKELAPHRVYSDGIRTWFDYGEEIKKKGLPAVYAVIDGVDTPINVGREGTKIVAQHSGSFTLRNGQKVVCIFPTLQEVSE